MAGTARRRWRRCSRTWLQRRVDEDGARHTSFPSPGTPGEGEEGESRTRHALEQCVLVDHLNPQLLRLVELAAGRLAGDDEAGLFAHAPRRLAAVLGDELFDLDPAELLQRPGDDDGLA